MPVTSGDRRDSMQCHWPLIPWLVIDRHREKDTRPKIVTERQIAFADTPDREMYGLVVEEVRDK